ncbi:TatD family hydrolase [Porphyromonas pogonae]|uniref:TatD family hydrolase n=1 Tax=Porphyromonas pogonae TaxID=867595 RepID=UPI002E7A9FD8|nr:TatD family hydrolase [Porphyromonas pogonae]
MIDSHTHIYEPEFDDDRADVIIRARQAGVSHLILPNIDVESLPRILSLHSQYPHYTSLALGLHPTSVKSDYESKLQEIKNALMQTHVVAIGEIGIDLYWDKTFISQQKDALVTQLRWAQDMDLPVILHVRDAFKEVFECIDEVGSDKLRGVFHSFTGDEDALKTIIGLPTFMIGINGVVTFKNSHLKNIIHTISLDRLLIETDAPYLSPVPKRGKRNEPAFLIYTLEFISNLYGKAVNDIKNITTANAVRLFSLKCEHISPKN